MPTDCQLDKRPFQVLTMGLLNPASNLIATLIVFVHLVPGIVCNGKFFPRIAVD
ncbi:hypothetical protein BDR05DRAFT_677520 [Suillus weaverae]|nr:hypothetical protein BDR05DRAFT_677520 [Suillus weaverae]